MASTITIVTKLYQILQNTPVRSFLMIAILAAPQATGGEGEDRLGQNAAAERGFRHLTEVPFIPPDFYEATFQDVWKEWPAELKKRAAAASPGDRRKMAFDRYGLTPRPKDTSGKPLQYTMGENGGWSMNCFTCHGGTVYGDPMPGAPNNLIALQSLTEETFANKRRNKKPPSRMDLGAMVIPLGMTNGSTNAVVFGMGLMDARDAELNVIATLPKFWTHHDMDAPPWWYFYKRPAMYIDGFAKKGHRGLMQFTLVPENGPDYYRRNEAAFKDVLAYITSLRPPTYSGPIDQQLKAAGQKIFINNCAECHGTYGDDWTYPNRRIPLAEIGTDPVRLTALSVAGRQKYADSWFAHAGEADQQETEVNPDGYVAPPLDGVWASAPYFHNGSVPTLWHLLHPDARPTVWRRTALKMDIEKVGLTIEEVDKVPSNEKDAVIRRSYFDTRQFGKKNSGHDYPNALSEAEKRALLEYLKTL